MPYLQVTGAPDPDDPAIDRLWLLVGTSESCEGGRCFSLPPSNRISRGDELIPAWEQVIAAGYPGVTERQIFEAWLVYRDARRFILEPVPGNPSPSAEHMMPIQFTLDPSKGLVVYAVSGKVSKSHAKDFLDAVLTHPDFRRGFHFLGDRREMVTARADEYARSVAALVEENRQQLAPCRWAVLVPNPVAYGMARMWSLMAGDTGVTVQPFYELGEAIEWIGLPHDYRPELLKQEAQSQADTRW